MNEKLVKEFIHRTGATGGYSLPELLATNYHMVQLFNARTIHSPILLKGGFHVSVFFPWRESLRTNSGYERVSFIGLEFSKSCTRGFVYVLAVDCTSVRGYSFPEGR